MRATSLSPVSPAPLRHVRGLQNPTRQPDTAVRSSVDDVLNCSMAAQRLYRQIAVSRKVDGQGGLELVGEEVVEQRVFTLAETELLGRLAGFGAMHSYGDYNMSVSLTHEDAYRLVVLMQRPCKAVDEYSGVRMRP